MKVVYLPISQIRCGENRFKSLDPDEFEKLVKSIKEYGILEPLHVVKEETSENNGEVTYRLVQGYQRYRAAKELGLNELPCVIVEDEDTVLGAEFDVNLYRRHLTKEEVSEYEQDKEKVKEELKSQWNIIPELQFLKKTLPKDLVEILSGWPIIKQKEFYNSLPVKYVDAAEEAAKEAEESGKKVKEITDKIKKKDEEIVKLTKKVKEMEAEIKNLNLVKNAKKEEMDKVLEMKEKEMEEELKKKYSGNELAVKLQEEKEKLQAHYEKKLKEEIDKAVEEERKIAERHSKEREELKKQLEPLQEQVKQLRADLKIAEQSEAIARKSEQWATNNLQRLVRQARVPETLELIVKDLANIRGKVLVYTDTLLRMGDVVQEEREMNLKVIAKFKAELKNLNEASKTIIDLLVDGFPSQKPDNGKDKSKSSGSSKSTTK